MTETQSNQLNLTVVALVALVAIVGLVALVINVSESPLPLASGSQAVSAEEQNVVGEGICTVANPVDCPPTRDALFID